MKVLGLIIGGAVVIFWAFMNLLLVQRVLEYRGLDQYHRGAIDFLGNQVRRERQMGIYRKGQRIGSTRFAMERVFEKEEMGFRIEFSTLLNIDLLGKGGNLTFDGDATLDPKMVPRVLKARLGLGGLKVRIEGQREAGMFVVAIKDGERVVFRQSLPLEALLLNDGLAPSIPVAGLKVGETYQVPVFDPIFRERSVAETKVLAAVERRSEGINVDCLLLSTTYHGMTFRSFVTPDGEVLRQEIPPPLDVVLIREPLPGVGRRP